MKVVVACGGTGGHAFPGLAVAEELAKRGHEVTVWDSGRDVESSVMKRWKGAVFSTGARQLAAKNAFAILRSILRCRKEMRRTRPDALLAMGSYSSLPPVLAARSCGVKVCLHEANTVPGKAVEFLSRFAETVATSFAMTAKFLPNAKTSVTGLPVRADIASGTRFPFIPPNAFVVFVTGGSQGAHAVNQLLAKALVLLKKELAAEPAARPLYVIHQTGLKDEGEVIGAYAAAGIPARARPSHPAAERDAQPPALQRGGVRGGGRGGRGRPGEAHAGLGQPLSPAQVPSPRVARGDGGEDEGPRDAGRGRTRRRPRREPVTSSLNSSVEHFGSSEF